MASLYGRVLDDGFGNVWEKCQRLDCALEIVRPGKVQCEKEGCPLKSPTTDYWNAAIEAAAKECEDPGNWTNKVSFSELAEAIRRLKR